jgi:hypothetical protein
MESREALTVVALTLEGSDLLNGNKHLQRMSLQRYLAEVRSCITGPYFMLSLKYRLNKSDRKQQWMMDDVVINIRR